jgi:hypothetical protein
MRENFSFAFFYTKEGFIKTSVLSNTFLLLPHCKKYNSFTTLIINQHNN